MDQELDDLLDSALVDFDQKLTINEPKSAVTIERTNLYVDEDLDYEDRPPPKQQVSAGASKPPTISDPNLGFNLSDENLKLFEGIFKDDDKLGGEAAGMSGFKNMFDMFQNSKDETSLLDNFQKVMSQLVNEETNLDDDNKDDFDGFENIEELNFLKKFASAATTNSEESATTDKKPTEASKESGELKAELTPMQKVLEDMNKNSEKVLKNSNTGGAFPFGADFLSSLTQSLNADDTTGGVGNDDASMDSATSMMMQPILSMLFSKDILYPSLKLMSENYDKYIEEKRETLNEQELNKCYEQKGFIKQMCDVFEKSSETDTKEVKAEQLKNILDLLEKCGMPPAELVPEVNPFEGLGDQMKTNGCPIS